VRAAAILTISLLFAATANADAPRLTGFVPDTLRLNSTLVVTGTGLGAPGRQVEVVLSGRLRGADGEREARATIACVAAGDREARCRLPRSFVEGPSAWPASSRFEGTVAVAGATLPVSMTVFPPDLLGLLASWFGFADDAATTPPWWSVVGVLVVAALFLLLAVFALFAGLASWAERRIAGRMQNRVGPNRVGPQGVLQWLADGLKCFMKEDFVPPGSLPILFRVGPYFAMLGVVLTFVTLPFGQFLSVSDLGVGVYYVLAVTGFTVVGILIGGFSSANKWSLLGGFRSAAQIISYEIPSGLAVLAVVALAGSLGFQSIIRAQGGLPWQWYVFHNPFTFVAFFVYLVSSLAEGNRTPFDLPEAESELVAGYNTEYSGMRFVFYLFAEWGNLYVMSALMTALFLGGWQLPGLTAAEQAASLPLVLAGWAVFTAKALALVFLVIWLRWTLPRVRIDQLMVVCWKYLVPLGAAAFLGSAAWGTFVHGVAQDAASFAMFGVGVAVAVAFVVKLVRTLRQGTLPVHLNPFV
jgi:NADH-quinone oxidoreductase subunit H